MLRSSSQQSNPEGAAPDELLERLDLHRVRLVGVDDRAADASLCPPTYFVVE